MLLRRLVRACVCQFVHRKVISSMSLQSEDAAAAAAEVRDAFWYGPQCAQWPRRPREWESPRSPSRSTCLCRPCRPVEGVCVAQTAVTAPNAPFLLLNCLRFSNAGRTRFITHMGSQRDWRRNSYSCWRCDIASDILLGDNDKFTKIYEVQPGNCRHRLH